MSVDFQDELWPHFVPLWTDLRTIAPALLLAGGYGLFLKQKWLVSQLSFLLTEDDQFITTESGERLTTEEGVRTLVAIDRWKDQSPRVTKDFDLIANLDLIASVKDQTRLQEALEKNGFTVVPANARWQFEKTVGGGRTVILDFHAPSPTETRDDIRVQSRRIKPLRSLGQKGIHGRENAEAISAGLHPFFFTYDGVDIVLPNPVTLALMKLVAMRDRRLASQDASKSADDRHAADREARKHAEDVCRVMAMMTQAESDRAVSVLDAVRTTSAFSAATEAFSKFFTKDEDWGSQAVTGQWRTEDYRIIHSTLAAWLR